MGTIGPRKWEPVVTHVLRVGLDSILWNQAREAKCYLMLHTGGTSRAETMFRNLVPKRQNRYEFALQNIGEQGNKVEGVRDFNASSALPATAGADE